MTLRTWALAVATGVITGLVVAGVAAGPLTALRAPRVETVAIYTADVLDTGTACAYTWLDQIFLWDRAAAGVTMGERCPSRDEAYRRWDAASRAPTSYRVAE